MIRSFRARFCAGPFRFPWNGLLVFLLLALCGPDLAAQFKFREPTGRVDPDPLSNMEGMALWNAFQHNRAAGTFSIKGLLVFRPPLAASVDYTVRLDADWRVDHESTRVRISGQDEKVTDVELRRSAEQAILVDYSGEAPDCRDFDESLWQNVIHDGLPFTWTDLMMPYLQWETITYLGPVRYLGRPAHRYELLDTSRDPFPARAVVTLDEDYAAMLRVDLFDAGGSLVQRLRVGGFRKFGDEWMFSELNWEDRATRSSTRLEVSTFVRQTGM